MNVIDLNKERERIYLSKLVRNNGKISDNSSDENAVQADNLIDLADFFKTKKRERIPDEIQNILLAYDIESLYASGNYDGVLFLGEIYLMYEEALDPSFKVYFFHACAAFELHNFAKCREICSRALDKTGKNSQFYRLMGLSWIDSNGLQQMKTCESYFQTALEWAIRENDEQGAKIIEKDLDIVRIRLETIENSKQNY